MITKLYLPQNPTLFLAENLTIDVILRTADLLLLDIILRSCSHVEYNPLYCSVIMN